MSPSGWCWLLASRNGRYKPTGRGKPANEYLLRAANDGTFPSINGLVDSNNLLSLEHMVPISVWDLDLAQFARCRRSTKRASRNSAPSWRTGCRCVAKARRRRAGCSCPVAP